MIPNRTIWMIRPWIDDFTAYDHFSHPLGFLTLANRLRKTGFEIKYVDCLSRDFSGANARLRTDRNGCGEYTSHPIKKPPAFIDIPRQYKHYGMSPEDLERTLLSLPAPGAILITSGMTYWYPSIVSVVECIKSVQPAAPVALGGVYPTICPDHAQTHCDAEYICDGHVPAQFFSWLSARTGIEIPAGILERSSIPAWDLVCHLTYGLISSSRGCLHNCRYCGAKSLNPEYSTTDFEAIRIEIEILSGIHGIRNIGFYDDDLGGSAGRRFIELLEFLKARAFPVKWHLPNALNASVIDDESAALMMACGFEQPRLSLPDMDARVGNNGLNDSTIKAFVRAGNCLRKAGYRDDRISMYLIAGLTGQKLSWIEKACAQLQNAGIKPYLAQFSPVPGTPLGDERLTGLGFQQTHELLLTNKILSVYRHKGWTSGEYLDLATRIKNLRTS
jgi:hypothetical protein